MAALQYQSFSVIREKGDQIVSSCKAYRKTKWLVTMEQVDAASRVILALHC